MVTDTRAAGSPMPTFRLHYFPESGNSYKLAMMLTLAGQTFEPVWTDFGGGVTRTPEWRRTVNVMGEIPVLETNGVGHTQTAPILLRLAQQYGVLDGRDEAEQAEILRWLFWDNHKLSGYMATYRYYRAFTPSPDPGMLAFFRRRLDDFLGILEGHLGKQPFVAATGRPSPTSRCAPTCLTRRRRLATILARAIPPSTRGLAALRPSQAGARRMICCRANGCSGMCDPHGSIYA
jgi:glutathione S-transferase